MLFGQGRVLFFAVWAGGRVFFAVWAGVRVFFLLFERVTFSFLLFGPGACYFLAVWAEGVIFFAVWAEDGSSLTYQSAWLVFKRPNNKKDQTAKKTKKNTGSEYNNVLMLGAVITTISHKSQTLQ